MAAGKVISGKDLLMSVKRENDTQFMTVICQVDLTYTKTRDSNFEDTKCGTDVSTGSLQATGTINGKARVDIQTSDNAISVNELEELIDNDSNFTVKFANSDESFYREGDAKLTNYEVSANSTDNTDFSIDIVFTDPASILDAPTT